MMKKTLTAAVTVALLGIASASWAQGAAGGGAAGGGAGTSGGAGGGGASPGASSNVPGGDSAPATPDSSVGTTTGSSVGTTTGSSVGTTTGSSVGTTTGTTSQDAASGGNVPSACFGLMGAERERCVNDNRGRAGVGSSQTPTHPGDAAKGDNRYNSPATGTGAHSVPGSGTGTGTRQ